MAHFVYILRSLVDGKRYVGMTADLSKRLEEHNGGRVTATKSRRPFVLMHHESCQSLAEARAREQYYKTAAGRRALNALGK
jgi:putative endonuclease